MQRVASSRTKRQLANALKCKLSSKPFAKISIRELTSECGIKRQSFYYHFPDIYALLSWMIEDELRTFLDAALQGQDLRASICSFLEYSQRNRSLFLNLLQFSEQPYLERSFTDALRRIIAQSLQVSWAENHDSYVEFLAQYYAALFGNVVKSWLTGVIIATAEEMTVFFFRISTHQTSSVREVS